MPRVRITAACLLVLAAALGTPLTATAAAETNLGVDGLHPRVLKIDGRRPTPQMLAPRDRAATPVPQSPACSDRGVPTGIGDLDGDGKADVVFAESCGGRMHLRARRGIDGSPLWSRATDLPSNAAWIRAAKVGAGDVGLLVAGYEERPGQIYVPTAAAVDKNGREIWRRTLAPAVSGLGPALAATSFLYDVGAYTSSAADDLVAFEAARLAGSAGAVTPLVIDGQSGAVRRGSPSPLLALATVSSTPDLSGDGLRDVVVAVQQMQARRSFVEASSPLSSSKVWSRLLDDRVESAFGVGDLDGDSASEVVLSVARDEELSQRRVAVLLDGRHGAERWRRDGWATTAIGDVDGDGLDEVAVMELALERSQTALTVAAVGIAGAARYERAVRAAVDGRPAGHGAWMQYPGDMDADGVDDFIVGVGISDEDEDVWTDVALRGRTGAVLWHGKPSALGDTLDGDGNDAYTTDLVDHVAVVVTAVDGRTNGFLWQLREPWLDGIWGVRVVGDIDGDGRADMNLTQITGGSYNVTGSVTISGADGSVLWRL